jgi:ATP/maltotriose-dependent transcriptional regulator MalT
MTGEKNYGVTISRTLIPTLPPGYLTRKHLFPLIDNELSGSTFVIAPAGYGKSSLVAEWAQNQEKGVIWLTVANGDTLNEMSAMLITATRRVLPDFAPWFEKEQPLRPSEVVRRWGNELLHSGRNYVLVLDNLRSEQNEDVEIANKLIEQFPMNLHFVAIRKNEIPEVYATCASRGPLKVVTVKDLRFTDEEIEAYAINSGLEASSENLRTLQSALGWPSATSLLRAHLQSNSKKFEIEQIMSSTTEPLRSLAMIVIDGLNEDVKAVCESLSVLEVFSLEQAELILGERYNSDLISSIAHKGEIFTLSRDPEGGYVFSPMVRQVFLERLRAQGELKNIIHQKLINYFETIGQHTSAIDHAFQLGDEEKITELFPSAARLKQAQGRGGDLLRWAKYAGDNSIEGELKKSTVAIAGYLADLDFPSALSETSKLSLLAERSPNREFFEQFAAGALSYSHLSLGKFLELEESVARTNSGREDSYLGVDDQINLLRLLCVKRYIWNDSVGVEEVALLSQDLVKRTTLSTSHSFNLAIQTMHLHQRGEYRRAYESSVMAISQFRRHRFVGNHGPLDVMYVMARTLLEFSRPKEALSILEQIRMMAYQWKQWHWYIASDKNIIEFQTYKGNQREALERIQVARDFIATLDPTNKLAQLVDINEMNVRRSLRDFDRLEKLVNRAPDIRDTRQFKMFIDEYRGRKNLMGDVKNLPESNPRDLIWKYLTEASVHIDAENIALPAMHQAMKIGSEVGAKETFLRQRDEMGNLIIKIASDFPTVYNEELATAMAARIKERGSTMTTGKPALTKRELEILRQLSTGRTLNVIAAELHISQNTMKTHLKNLYKKLSAEGRHDAVEKAKAAFLI